MHKCLKSQAITLSQLLETCEIKRYFYGFIFFYNYISKILETKQKYYLKYFEEASHFFAYTAFIHMCLIICISIHMTNSNPLQYLYCCLLTCNI